MSELQRWFGPLDALLDPPQLDPPDLGSPGTPVPGRLPSIAPTGEEMDLLLAMGKRAAQVGPQRMFALLTAFGVGRALGRREAADPGTDRLALLQAALDHLRAMGGEADSPAPDTPATGS